MKNIKEYLKSIIFSLNYSFRFVPRATWVMVFLYIFSGVLGYGNSFLLGKLVDVVILSVKTSSSEVWYMIIIYAVVSGLPGIISNLQLYVNRRRMVKLQMEIELDIMKQREKIDIARYEDPRFQDLIQRAFRNGPNPIYQLSNTQFDILRAVTGLITGTIIAIRFDVFVYLIVVIAAIPSFITDIKFAGQSWSIWSKDSPEQRRFGDLRQHFIFRIFLIETKLLQSSGKLLSWMRKILADFGEKQLKLEKNRVWLTSVTDAIALLGLAWGLILVLKGVVSSQYQVGTFVFMVGVLNSVRASITNLLEMISGQYENNLIVRDMQEFMNTKPIVIESKNPKILNIKMAPEIIFENVSFKYDNSDKLILKKINLILRAGDNIGLVGNNGAGKTTLVKLLCRIYDPTEGRIIVNGVDLREISIKEWWSYLAVMLQDYAGYDFLVKDAIAIGRSDKPANFTKVVEAAHVSQSHVFIEEWKDKYDQQLGVEFSGKEPSKGQRQKLSIAKTLYRDGLVMILDEPTASVDAESESKIFDSIENLPEDRTAILISHDFSTISACDKIFVLDEGKLIEEGDHKELMSQKGKYAELYNLQAKRFKK